MNIKAIQQRFSEHVLKEIINTGGVEAYFCYRPNFMEDSFTLVSLKGCVAIFSPSFGDLSFHVFEGDPLQWFFENPDAEQWLSKVPDSFKDAYKAKTLEAFNFVCAIECVLRLVEKNSFDRGRFNYESAA